MFVVTFQDFEDVNSFKTLGVFSTVEKAEACIRRHVSWNVKQEVQEDWIKRSDNPSAADGKVVLEVGNLRENSWWYAVTEHHLDHHLDHDMGR